MECAWWASRKMHKAFSPNISSVEIEFAYFIDLGILDESALSKDGTD